MARTFLVLLLSSSLILPPAVANPTVECLLGMQLLAAGPQARINEVGEGIKQEPGGPVKTVVNPDYLWEKANTTAVVSVPRDFLVDHYKELSAQEALTHVPVTGAILIGTYILYRIGGGREIGRTAAAHRASADTLLASEELVRHSTVLAEYKTALEKYEDALVRASEEKFAEWSKQAKKMGGITEVTHPGAYTANLYRATAFIRRIKNLRKQRKEAEKKSPEEAEEIAIRKMTAPEFEQWSLTEPNTEKVARLSEVRREKGVIVEEPPLDIVEARLAMDRAIENLRQAEKAVYDRANALNVHLGDPKDPFDNAENPTGSGYAHHPRFYYESNERLREAIENFKEGWRKWVEGPAENTWDYRQFRYPWNWPYNLLVAGVNTGKHFWAMIPRDMPPWIPAVGERGLLGWKFAGRPVANTVRSMFGILGGIRYFIGVKGGALLSASAMALLAHWFTKQKKERVEGEETAILSDEAKRFDAEAEIRNEAPSAGEMLFSMIHMWATMKRAYPEDFPDFPFDLSKPEQRQELEKMYEQALAAENRERKENPEAYATERVFKVEVARRFWKNAFEFAQGNLGLNIENEALYGENLDGKGGLTDTFAVAYPDAVQTASQTLQRFEYNLRNLRKLMKGKDTREEFEAILKKQEELMQEGKIDPAYQLTPQDMELLREFLNLTEEETP